MFSRLAVVIAMLIAVGALVGCNSTRCARHSDCAVGEVCETGGFCAVAPISTDAGEDAGDAGVSGDPDAALDASVGDDAGLDDAGLGL